MTKAQENLEFPGWAVDLHEDCPKWLQSGTICSHDDGLFCDHRAIVVNGELKVKYAKEFLPKT